MSLQFEPTIIPKKSKKYKLQGTSGEVYHLRNPIHAYRRPPVYQPGNCPLRRGSAKFASWVWPDSNRTEINSWTALGGTAPGVERGERALWCFPHSRVVNHSATVQTPAHEGECNWRIYTGTWGFLLSDGELAGRAASGPSIT